MRRYAFMFWVVIGIVAWWLAGGVRAEVPGLINYQGKLTDELGVPVNRDAEMTFAIYTEAAGGGSVWSESQDVQVTDGIFNVLLGSVNPLGPDYFAEGPETYLGVKIGEDSELAPRQKIASTAYSLRSEISEVAEELSSSGRISLLEAVYPIDSIYISTAATNPAVIFGFGTWTAFGDGRVPVGYNGGDSDFNAVEKTGGAKTHTLTAAEMPSHTHTQNAHSHTVAGLNISNLNAFTINDNSGDNIAIADNAVPGVNGTIMVNKGTSSVIATNKNTGGGEAHNILQPYIVVYMWKRTG